MKGGVNKVSIDNRQRFTLRLPSQLLELIGIKANSIGVPINSLILQILWDWIKKEEAASTNERRAKK